VDVRNETTQNSRLFLTHRANCLPVDDSSPHSLQSAGDDRHLQCTFTRVRRVISVCRHVCEFSSFPHCLHPCSSPGRTLNLTLTYTVHERNTCQLSPMAILTTNNINLLNCRSSLLNTFNVGRYSDGATRWTFQGSHPGGDAFFRTRPDRRWGPPSGYRVIPGGKAAGSWR